MSRTPQLYHPVIFLVGILYFCLHLSSLKMIICNHHAVLGVLFNCEVGMIRSSLTSANAELGDIVFDVDDTAESDTAAVSSFGATQYVTETATNEFDAAVFDDRKSVVCCLTRGWPSIY